MKTKRPDKFQRWMIASFFLIPLVLFVTTLSFYYFYMPVKMKVLIHLLRYQWTRSWAHQSIYNEGERAVPYLINGLRDKNARIRELSVYKLRHFAALQIKCEGVVPPLIKLFSDTDAGVRAAAAQALGYFADKRAVPGLIILLGDADLRVRYSAARALGKIGSEDAVAPLIKSLSDPETYVRQTAARALAEIGSKEAVEPLTEALSDPEFNVRQNAAWALGEIGSRQVVRNLIACLKEEMPPTGIPGQWRSFRNSVTGALEKITGQSFGKFSQTTSDPERQEIIQKWLQWWEENKDKYEAEVTTETADDADERR